MFKKEIGDSFLRIGGSWFHTSWVGYPGERLAIPFDFPGSRNGAQVRVAKVRPKERGTLVLSKGCWKVVFSSCNDRYRANGRGNSQWVPWGIYWGQYMCQHCQPKMYQVCTKHVYIYTHYTYVSIPSIYYVDYVDSWFNLCLKSRPSFEENKVQPSRTPHLLLLFMTWKNSNHYSNMNKTNGTPMTPATWTATRTRTGTSR